MGLLTHELYVLRHSPTWLSKFSEIVLYHFGDLPNKSCIWREHKKDNINLNQTIDKERLHYSLGIKAAKFFFWNRVNGTNPLIISISKNKSKGLVWSLDVIDVLLFVAPFARSSAWRNVITQAVSLAQSVIVVFNRLVSYSVFFELN